MKRHPIDAVSLIMGIVAVGGAIAWIAWDAGDVSGEALLISVPITLIIAGIAGLAVSLRGTFHD